MECNLALVAHCTSRQHLNAHLSGRNVSRSIAGLSWGPNWNASEDGLSLLSVVGWSSDRRGPIKLAP